MFKIHNLDRYNLFKNASIYTIASFLNASIPFLLMPILTRKISPEDYGIVASFQGLIGLISPFIGLGIDGSIEREYFKNQYGNISGYITNCFYLLFTSSFIILFFIYFFSSSIVDLIDFPSKWLFSIVIVSLGQYMTLVLLMLWQVKNMGYIKLLLH